MDYLREKANFIFCGISYFWPSNLFILEDLLFEISITLKRSVSFGDQISSGELHLPSKAFSSPPQEHSKLTVQQDIFNSWLNYTFKCYLAINGHWQRVKKQTMLSNTHLDFTPGNFKTCWLRFSFNPARICWTHLCGLAIHGLFFLK